jgi:hypothetical protein
MEPAEASWAAQLARCVERVDYGGAVALMRAHAGSAKTQLASCEALVAMTPAGGYADAARASAGHAGAVEACVTAMVAHAAHGGVQRAACEALHNLLANHAANSRRACAAGGVAAAVAVLRHDELAHDGVAAAWACKLLYSLHHVTPGAPPLYANLEAAKARPTRRFRCHSAPWMSPSPRSPRARCSRAPRHAWRWRR